MTLVEALSAGGDPAVLDAHLAFQLGAGVDVVLVSGGARGDVNAVLDSYRDGVVRIEGGGDSRRAAVERGASWLIESTAEEFWWPRAASLKDVLAPVPPRYTVVQALVRQLIPVPGGGHVRPVLGRGEAPAGLRKVRRVRPQLLLGDDDADVPLRAWYPIEVLRLSDESPGEASVERGLADGSLVADSRLRDVFDRVAQPAAPSVVEDAAYAAECAAVGEVDLAVLDEHIRALEARITLLEERLWPRVVRRVTRLASRRRV
jgi:hypothetical protein